MEDDEREYGDIDLIVLLLACLFLTIYFTSSSNFTNILAL